ncbi:hypothetical protein KY385_03130 [Candidatus Parcubacteria bacterium]|nr:hypothetical protein [Candidatus Parcubacteria bacterium]
MIATEIKPSWKVSWSIDRSNKKFTTIIANTAENILVFAVFFSSKKKFIKNCVNIYIINVIIKNGTNKKYRGVLSGLVESRNPARKIVKNNKRPIFIFINITGTKYYISFYEITNPARECGVHILVLGNIIRSLGITF